MEEGFFEYLPSEIIVDILLRLPLRSIQACKCACKSLLEPAETDDFVNSHLAKSISALAVVMPYSKSISSWCKIFELRDEIDLRYKFLTEFEFPFEVTIEGSANGLLLLRKRKSHLLYICNPITREYSEICRSEKEIDTFFRFGVSKISGQYKVVAVDSQSECSVYTLGTESWRKVEAPASIDEFYFGSAAFVNGSLYWTDPEPEQHNHLLACFDLETECFSSFPAPAPGMVQLFVLKDCLCFCKAKKHGIVIWSMLENGGERSWRKDYVMSQGPIVDHYIHYLVYPIKAFKNGDVLMLLDGEFLYCYFSKTQNVEEIVGGVFGAEDDFSDSMLLTPSFLHLRGLGMENVISF